MADEDFHHFPSLIQMLINSLGQKKKMDSNI